MYAVKKAEIFVGTSGYSYKYWQDVYYPNGMKPDDYLGFYTGDFGAVEINSTYYGIPKPSVFENMAIRTPEKFEFIVKANKATTHEMKDSEVSKEFLESVKPLAEQGKLSGILIQFPWGFRNIEQNRKYLASLRDGYREYPLFVEFRHDSWNRDEIYNFLRSIGVCFVTVDEPQIGNMMPPVVLSTGDTAYIRFHGRNAETWWGTSGDRYDYDYSAEELEEWIEKVEELEKTVWKIYAFFNNCHKGYAVRNALMFRDMVKKRGSR